MYLIPSNPFFLLCDIQLKNQALTISFSSSRMMGSLVLSHSLRDLSWDEETMWSPLGLIARHQTSRWWPWGTSKGQSWKTVKVMPKSLQQCNSCPIHLCLWLHWLGLKQKQTAAYLMQSASAAYWLGSYYNSNPFNITATSTLATFGKLIQAMEKCLLNAVQLLEKVTSNVWMCSNLSASHCLIFLSFPAVKNRWVLGTNWRNMTLERKDNRERTEDDK